MLLLCANRENLTKMLVCSPHHTAALCHFTVMAGKRDEGFLSVSLGHQGS